jgi:prepilin-type N-terminal cleavage/methylation domain-containing protein
MKKNYKAFTLIEVIITLTILALIFSSVMSVFIFYSTLWARVEVNRVLQSNIKVIVEHITYDIRNNNIVIADWITDPWHYFDGAGKYSVLKEELVVWDVKYYLANKWSVADIWDELFWTNYTSWNQVFANDYDDKCLEIDQNCTLIKELADGTKVPLTNSWVSFKNLHFYVSQEEIPKVTINFDLNIADWKGIKYGLIESSNIKIQTTIAEKLLDKNK